MNLMGFAFSSRKQFLQKTTFQYYLKLIQLIIEKNGITSLQNLTSIIKEEPRPTFGQTTTITTTGIPNNTPLHLALMRSDLPETVIANLAEHGHNSTPDQYGNTPLHLALATIQTKIALTITKKIIIQSTHKQTLYEENNNNQSLVNIAQKQIMKLQSTSPQSPLIQELNSIIQLIEDNQEKKIEADPDLLF